jgi:hypothetical protein
LHAHGGRLGAQPLQRLLHVDEVGLERCQVIANLGERGPQCEVEQAPAWLAALRQHREPLSRECGELRELAAVEVTGIRVVDTQHADNNAVDRDRLAVVRARERRTVFTHGQVLDDDALAASHDGGAQRAAAVERQQAGVLARQVVMRTHDERVAQQQVDRRPSRARDADRLCRNLLQYRVGREI